MFIKTKILLPDIGCHSQFRLSCLGPLPFVLSTLKLFSFPIFRVPDEGYSRTYLMKVILERT